MEAAGSESYLGIFSDLVETLKTISLVLLCQSIDSFSLSVLHTDQFTLDRKTVPTLFGDWYLP